MEVLKAIIYLIIGFALLVKGADFFVDGASAIAKKLRIPSLVIGLTIVAMGTSLPELSVSITAALQHENTLAISNVVGSNIFNLMVVLGICAVIAPIGVSMTVTKRDYPFSVFCAVLLGVLGFLGWSINRADGVILLIFFALYMFVMVKSALTARKESLAEEAGKSGGLNAEELAEAKDDIELGREADEMTTKAKEIPLWLAVIYVIGGAVAVKFGGDFTVDGAVSIAEMLGVTQTLIGLTIVACGTSLPELVTSIVASRKNELDMAVGNVVGSNIFNILAILGIGAVITPMTFMTENIIDIIVLAVFSLIVWLFCYTKKEIGRKEGAAMLILYAVYLVYICVR